MPAPSTDIETRINVSLAVRRYIAAADRLHEATSEFADACDSLRSMLQHRRRFVVEERGQHYLVTSDREGNFDVERIEAF